VLAELDKRLTTQIVEKLDPEKAAEIVEEMEPDQAADLLAQLSPEASRELLDELPGDEAQEVQALLRFEENSAGGMMNTDFVFVGETATKEEVVEWIRSKEVNPEQLDSVFVINGEAKFSGVVALGRVLLASPTQRMAELKSETLVSVAPEAEDKDVFELFDKYNLRILCVVDQSGRPIGAITVDDVVTRLRARG
jgi:Mg/Co/Ni transporter MgtE